MKINGTRLWDSLMEMAKFGATEKGGCRRLALTDLDRLGRDLFQRWCTEAGCRVRVDEMGNLFARREGRDPELPPVLAGSHLDTQPSGGKFDGVYGVLAALEVMRTLQDEDHTTGAPVEAVCWTNEEGARFPPAMIGSGVFAGIFDLEYGHSRTDPEGRTIREELERIGYLGEVPCRLREIGAYYELHIEQGPVLEREGRTIGVVTGGQGSNWYHVRIRGLDSHAGTTPMLYRRDAMQGAARIINGVRDIVLEHQDAVGTTGSLEVHPNSINTVPGEVFFTIDLRHPEGGILGEIERKIREMIAAVCKEENLESELDSIWEAPTVVFDSGCVSNVRESVRNLGYPFRDMISGAGHDACQLTHVAPTAMIFIPCKDGISHNELESALPEDVTAGANVLLQAMLKSAG